MPKSNQLFESTESSSAWPINGILLGPKSEENLIRISFPGVPSKLTKQVILSSPSDSCDESIEKYKLCTSIGEISLMFQEIILISIRTHVPNS